MSKDLSKVGRVLPARLSRAPVLAPRAGDTSGRLRAPRLPEGGRGQRPPAPPPGAKRTAPRPGPPSARPSVAPPAAACGARTSLQPQPEDTPARGGGRPRSRLPAALAAPGIEAGRGRPTSTASSAFLLVTQPFPPPPNSSNFPLSSDQSQPLPGLPPSKARAQSPLLAARLRSRPRPAPGERSCPGAHPPHLEPGAGQALQARLWWQMNEINVKRQAQYPAACFL